MAIGACFGPFRISSQWAYHLAKGGTHGDIKVCLLRRRDWSHMSTPSNTEPMSLTVAAPWYLLHYKKLTNIRTTLTTQRVTLVAISKFEGRVDLSDSTGYSDIIPGNRIVLGLRTSLTVYVTAVNGGSIFISRYPTYYGGLVPPSGSFEMSAYAGTYSGVTISTDDEIATGSGYTQLSSISRGTSGLEFGSSFAELDDINAAGQVDGGYPWYYEFTASGGDVGPIGGIALVNSGGDNIVIGRAHTYAYNNGAHVWEPADMIVRDGMKFRIDNIRNMIF